MLMLARFVTPLVRFAQIQVLSLGLVIVTILALSVLYSGQSP